MKLLGLYLVSGGQVWQVLAPPGLITQAVQPSLASRQYLASVQLTLQIGGGVGDGEGLGVGVGEGLGVGVGLGEGLGVGVGEGESSPGRQMVTIFSQVAAMLPLMIQG